VNSPLFHNSIGQGGQPIGGVETAPDKLREAGLLEALYNLGWEVKDMGNVDMKNELNEKNDPPVAGINAPIRVRLSASSSALGLAS